MSSALAQLKSDPDMARLIDRIGAIHLKPRNLQPYESLIHAVIHQQLNGKAADTILSRFLMLFGKKTFPTPQSILKATPELLREAGLSRPKVAYIRGIAEETLKGEIPTLEDCAGLSDEEIIARLTHIKGIGRWTVEMFLIFNLNRPDVLPADDLGIRRGFQNLRNLPALPTPRELSAYGEKWSPYRTLASLYLWKAAA